MYSGHNKWKSSPQGKQEEQAQEKPKQESHCLCKLPSSYWGWRLWSGIPLWANSGQLSWFTPNRWWPADHGRCMILSQQNWDNSLKKENKSDWLLFTGTVVIHAEMTVRYRILKGVQYLAVPLWADKANYRNPSWLCATEHRIFVFPQAVCNRPALENTWKSFPCVGKV